LAAITHSGDVTVIDPSIAVVIDAVANLCDGAGLDLRNTANGTVAAGCGADCAQPVLTRNVTGFIGTRIAFVDSGVAVIINIVADLSAGLHVRDTHQGAPLTLGSSFGASTRPIAPYIAGTVALGVALIRIAVAVIVEAITQLHFGVIAAIAHEFGVHTAGEAIATQPGLTGATGPKGADGLIIDLAVTVIVFAVTDLETRAGRLDTHQRARDAG